MGHSRANLNTVTDQKQDATKKLPPDAPTQKTEKGLKIGVPKRGDVHELFRRAAKPKG